MHRARGDSGLAAVRGHARRVRRHRAGLAGRDRAGTALCCSESPAYVARGIAALAADPGVPRYAGKSLTSGQLARIYGVTDTDGSRPDGWSYVTEIEDADLPAREAGYR